ncbi:MAG: hypothetical protein JNK58_13920 [Phycisphaerae bacterium]|nr:hypothetical protein [Phycisphaerae bacterium]
MLSSSPFIRLGTLSAALFASILSLLAPSAAIAQGAAPASPRFVTPIAEGVMMRCSPGAAWYPVATLKPGTVLKADADVEGWLRVEYLPGMNVVVKADEGDLKEAEGTIVLTRRTRLRALSQADPIFDESYKAVFEEFLAPGLALKYVGTIKNRAGENAGYIVAPPPGAKGYVSAREVRDAKPEEVSAPAKHVEQPKPPAATQAPAAATTQTATTQPPPAAPASTEPVTESTTPPASTEPASAEPAPAATPTEFNEPRVAQPAPPPTPRTPTLRQLDRAFDDLMAKPLADADPQELIEQYNQFGDALTNEVGSGRTIKYIDTRVQLLKIRQRARDLLPEIQALEDASRNAAANYRLTIDRLIANREYKVVGRLYPSTVYDGTRLPQMYRLISIDPGVKTTLAYVVPVAEHQLEQKVGSIVGILGDGKVEPSAMVEIITPTVVDVLRSAAELPPE